MHNNPSPPRLITGAALIFWGVSSGQSVIGLIAALIVESSAWLPLRWNFKRSSYVRAWHISVFCGVLAAAIAWLNGLELGRFHTLFVWIPLILLPIELAQRYGRGKRIPLNTFSYFARKKMEQDITQGRQVSPRMINTGYAYIAFVLLASAVVSKNELHYFIGFSIITSICIFLSAKQAGYRSWAWPIAMLATLAMAYTGQKGLFYFYQLYRGSNEGEQRLYTQANESRTSIGRLGRIKMSPRIFWRMKVNEGNIPHLLRVASYNHYTNARWIHDFEPPSQDSQRDEEDYIIAQSIEINNQRIDSFIEGDDSTLDLHETPYMRILGTVNNKLLENPIPIPDQAVAIGDLSNETITYNSLGTVLMANPDYHVISYSIWTGEGSEVEAKPNRNLDLSVPDNEREVLEQVAWQLGLYEMTTQQKVARLKKWFSEQFVYSTYLDTPKMSLDQRKTAMGIFLETNRSGHCEYFATATTMLLRVTGVPARYCVGFSVSERDNNRDEWVMRGHHAHAWTRVWTGNRWEDVDLTPPEWLTMDNQIKTDWRQNFKDWWQRFREDFLLWRTEEANKNKIIITLAALAILLLLWITWRLWHSRVRNEKNKAKRRRAILRSEQITPLHKLELLISKSIGSRPSGTPMLTWLEQTKKLQDNELDDLSRNAAVLHNEIRFNPALSEKKELMERLSEVCLQIKQRLKYLKRSSKKP